MIKQIFHTIYISVTLMLFACSSNSVVESKQPIQASEQKTNSAQAAKAWLEKALLHFFNDGLNDIESITTPQYAEYKSDMINSDYDGLTYEELKAKWGKIYEVDESKIGLGFLIDLQDWDEVLVDKCLFVKSVNDSTFEFVITLREKSSNHQFTSTVTVVRQADSFAIDNVLEKY